MPTNVYFSPKVKTEQNIFEDIVIESIRMYGQDVYYLPREVVNRDYILGEDVESQFEDAYMIEMYIENTEGFEGEGNIFQKFGMEIRDECTFVVAKRSWEKLVGRWNNTVDNFRPNEGDLIYLPLSNSFFEISFVEHEQPFYQLNNLPMYKLQARLFEFSGEDFQTGISEIDQIETAHAYQLGLRVGDVQGTLSLGDVIFQVTATDSQGAPTRYVYGRLVDQQRISDLERILYLTDISSSDGNVASFYVSTDNVNATYIGYRDALGVTVFRAKVVEIENIANTSMDTFTNDNWATNSEFEQTADGIIDFSEINPFGDPSDV